MDGYSSDVVRQHLHLAGMNADAELDPKASHRVAHRHSGSESAERASLAADRARRHRDLREYPGLDEDLYITAEAEAFVKWHAGQLAWAEATPARRIRLDGPSWLVRAFPTWNARSAFAHIKPVLSRLVQATA